MSIANNIYQEALNIYERATTEVTTIDYTGINMTINLAGGNSDSVNVDTIDDNGSCMVPVYNKASSNGTIHKVISVTEETQHIKYSDNTYSPIDTTLCKDNSHQIPSIHDASYKKILHTVEAEEPYNVYSAADNMQQSDKYRRASDKEDSTIVNNDEYDDNDDDGYDMTSLANWKDTYSIRGLGNRIKSQFNKAPYSKGVNCDSISRSHSACIRQRNMLKSSRDHFKSFIDMELYKYKIGDGIDEVGMRELHIDNDMIDNNPLAAKLRSKVLYNIKLEVHICIYIYVYRLLCGRNSKVSSAILRVIIVFLFIVTLFRSEVAFVL